MNWVLMLVLLVLVCCAIYGYTKGFFKDCFFTCRMGDCAGVCLVGNAACQPVDTGEYNHLRKIEAACEESVRRAAQGKMEEGAVEQYGEAGELGLDLPESVMAQIVSGASGAADTVLAETGYMQGSRRAWQDLSCRELRL